MREQRSWNIPMMGWAIAAGISLSLAVGAAGAQTPSSRPAAPAVEAAEPELHRPARGATTATPSSSSPSVPSKPFDLHLPQILGALAVVLALAFALRWLLRNTMGGGAGHRSSGAIQVLSRSAIAPRQQLMLIRIGRRLVLVANTGTQMNALCEITDPEEVASLLGQIQQEKHNSITGTFASLFGRAKSEFPSADASDQHEHDETAEREELDPAAGTTREELNGLLDKVRAVSQRFRA